MTCYYCYWLYTDEESMEQFCSIDQSLDNEENKCPHFLFDNGEVKIDEI